MENPAANSYFEIGCGRCKLVGTPACKVKSFATELLFLRGLLLESGLIEEVKWSMPCYTCKGKNVLVLSAFKEYCSINFFRGSELSDAAGLLVKAGEHSQSGRQLRFRNMLEIEENLIEIKALISQAVFLENEGIKQARTAAPEIPWPEELSEILEEKQELKRAFEKLSPGRRRSFLLHFTAARQSATRRSRILACIPKIIEGKGLQDR